MISAFGFTSLTPPPPPPVLPDPFLPVARRSSQSLFLGSAIDLNGQQAISELIVFNLIMKARPSAKLFIRKLVFIAYE